MLMAGDMHMALDPALIGERVGLTLDPWQSELIRTQPRRCLMLCSRQAGKSTATALLALHVAIYQPDSLLLPSQRQSQELLRTLMMYHGKLEGAPSLTAESLLRAELSNGSRIIALPGGGEGKTVRGFAAVRLAVVDEAARCEDGLFAVVRPMLGNSDGSLIMLSTPFGKRAKFHRAWTEGEGRFAAELGEAHALHEELKDFRRHLTTAGRATYQARTGRHDDLVLAVAIALWWAVERRKHTMRVGPFAGALLRANHRQKETMR